MEKQTIESLLEDVEFNTLTQIYYQFFSYDCRLPDLFSLLGEVKSRQFITRAVKPIHRFLAWIGCKAQR